MCDYSRGSPIDWPTRKMTWLCTASRPGQSASLLPAPINAQMNIYSPDSAQSGVP